MSTIKAIVAVRKKKVLPLPLLFKGLGHSSLPTAVFRTSKQQQSVFVSNQLSVSLAALRGFT